MKHQQVSSSATTNISAGSPYKRRPLRILFSGDSTSGKTTLVSVLSTRTCDNGCGSARKSLLQHPHEKESGHTSQITSYILRYGESTGSETATTLTEQAQKIVHVFDGCGLKGNLKAMVHGFTSTAPDYVFLLVAADTGISSITREHMGIALALHLPIVVVVTKTDLCKPETMKATLDSIETLIRKGTNKEPLPLYSPAGPASGAVASAVPLEKVSSEIFEHGCIPILAVSAVSGEGLPKLHELLSALELPVTVPLPDKKAPIELWIRKVYDVPEIGIILEGLLHSGKIVRGQFLRLGPLEDDTFRLVTVKSIVTCTGDVKSAEAGQDVAIKVVPADAKELSITDLKKEKGLVLVSKIEKSRLAKAFDAEIVVVSRAFIKKGRVATAHTGNVVQSIEVDDLAGDEILKQGDKGLIRCKFGEDSTTPYMKTGEKVLFRSGFTIAVGVITKIYT